ncbi:hypothetical protein [Pseudoalteromonas luteoviolacea]|uniref:Uncharacterized protein n=1 Tax=Pseudoalteromonas luteoviolacea S4054 TaxID=1129367 RepID=A0A0F6AFI4_9GAMM|nr:hypothetical protein [Pseudoalteromonas luteoviolacea]AOT09309.1 hypothetical protein S4054249_16290 [Pseudoalteromonas luteoviolacea]AOT14221.1 hypothetical protein S40542_16260 [Pseudoalteromonas luteoviolacea]AOT19137.1 hypothetical protein S4054_16265 [Pseudoalteromonas luteoviolacea]KKE84972.1 hypothetical protein N479_05950 [Pseudoalteromonas luteoviolacea S4054]KZN70090.1 hypothetical protein N481_01060 [Pseudoalteromonas luteoviolacea S4047-1]
MKKILLFTLISAFSFIALAEEEKKELPPLNPAYKGEHGMVLMNRGSKIYATNFASYKLPSDIQIVYQIDNPDVAFLNLVRDSDLITIKPKPFNLQRLERGEEVNIVADIYEGHYQRDGFKVYSDRTIVFSKKLYARKIKDLPAASQWQEYDSIELNKSERIYIHKLTQPPSFNHLIFVDLTNACMQKFKTSKRVPKSSELMYKFVNCGTLKHLYFDAEDYR